MIAQLAKHWINGEWVESQSVGESIDPATGNVIGRFADGGAVEAESSIHAAKKAFTNSRWREDKNFRADVIEKLAACFEHHTEELVAALCLENGKIRREALFEITMLAPKLRYNGALARSYKGESGSARPGSMSMIVHEPVGVVGVIVPWNSPVVLMIRSVAPALAAGNAVVVKMPAQTALLNALVASIFAQVPELPKGIVNFFTESGDEGSKSLVSSPDVPVISYTGSTHVGAMIAAQAARHLKRCSLELGGKTPHLIFADADLELMIPTLAASVTVFAGQFCMAGSRVIVHEDIAENVIDGIKRRFAELRLGAAADPQSQMGPMIDKGNVARVDRAVEQAIEDGAEVMFRGGPVVEGPLASGAFYRPTLLKVTDPNLSIVQQETFGPVMTVQTFATEEEGIALANDSEFGLAAAVWTRDTARAFRVAGRMEAGTVWLNDWAQVHDEFEEGGYKKSGMGRLNGSSGIDDFLEIKHITFSTTSSHAAH
ncbi:aldehyde dehydrogenase family protein [Pseudomonas sp. X10]